MEITSTISEAILEVSPTPELEPELSGLDPDTVSFYASVLDKLDLLIVIILIIFVIWFVFWGLERRSR